MGVFFAIALIDASDHRCDGGVAVDGLCDWRRAVAQHSLHQKPSEAKGFYAVYGRLVVLAAALVLTPGMPLGTLTNAV